MAIDLKGKVREVPDFPTPGISFKDIMPLLGDAEALRETVDRLGDWAAPREPAIVVGGEARGFFIGAAIAYKLRCGFVPARRRGKLPLDVISAEYELEYGRNALELQKDSIREGTRVFVHDDVLATGGTARAMAQLVEELGGVVVGFGFIIELEFLNGRRQIDAYDVCSLIRY